MMQLLRDNITLWTASDRFGCDAELLGTLSFSVRTSDPSG